MIARLHILFFCLISGFLSVSQDLLKSRTTSHFTHVYRLTNEQAERFYAEDTAAIDSSFFADLFDRYPTDSAYNSSLPNGHFLRAYVRKSRLELEMTSVHSFNIDILNNSTDLQVKVYLHEGSVVDKADVKLKGRTLRYDSRSETYRLKKTNREGLLKVSYNGEVAFSRIDREYNNSGAKRLLRKTLNGVPVRYVWRPVRFVLLLPVDGVKSFRYGPVGSIRKTTYFFERLYRSVACLFDDYYCEDRDYKFPERYQGYMAFDKPLYKPGDTVKLKAYITGKRGKPLNREVEVVLRKGYNSGVILGRVQPLEKGAYVFQFPLSDTLDLKLDQSYTIRIRKREERVYLSNSFNLEEYELAKNNLALFPDKEEFFKGDTVIIRVSGKDENDLNLLDARLSVLVRPAYLNTYFDSQVFVRDTLTWFELPLEASGDTEVKIPSSIFPKANLGFEVNVTLRTTDNERMTETETLDYYHEKKEIDFQLVNDSVKIAFKKNGVVEEVRARVSGMDGFGRVVESETYMLPQTLVLNPFYSEYQVETGDLKKSFSISEESAMLSFSSDRTMDSVFVNAYNPRRIPFNYHLYRNNREVEHGLVKDLAIQRKSGARPYYLSVQYLWGGMVLEEEYEIPLRKDLLNVTLDTPPVVFPGQTAEIQIAVHDLEGRPVPDTDILLQGLTKKFNASPVNMPDYSGRTKERRLINQFSRRNRMLEEAEMPVDYDYWNPQMTLDSISYFQFLYPGDSLYRFEYTPADSTTQVSPFVIKDGVIQAVKVVYIDRRPVYFNWSVNEPYSFRVDSGYHQLRIRTRDRQYQIDRVYFPYGKKVILSFDQEKLPENVFASEKPSKLSEGERNNLFRYMLPYRHTFGGRYGYFQQGDRLYPVFEYSYRNLTGPVAPTHTKFQLIDRFELRFAHEPGFEYELKEGLLKMRTSDLEESFRPLQVQNKPIESLSDLVWTRRMIERKWEHELARRRKSSRRYRNPYKTDPSRGQLILEIGGDEISGENTLLLKLDDNLFFRVYPRIYTNFHDLDAGYYQAITLLEDGSYIKLDSIKIEIHGINYYLFEDPEIHEKDTFSIQINEQMDRYFSEHSGFLGETEKQALRRTYQRNFRYFGDGRVVSGYIMDDTGEGLSGVNVIIKGTTFGTTTDLHGFYSLKVPDFSSELIYSFVGFETQEIEVGSRSTIDITMGGITELQEVVITGLGVSTSRSKLAYSISSLAGKVPGVKVLNTSGAPSEILIRGAASIRSGNDPLIIIDGVIYSGSLADLNGNEIAGIEVLKGAQATGLYGSRAANGVIVVTSKGGALTSTSLKTKGVELTADYLQKASEASSIRTNFSDVGIWEPTLRTDKDGRATVEVTFPDDITKWETFVYAVNGRKQVGQARGEIRSFKPVSAQLNIPNFLVLGDSSNVLGKSLNYTSDTLEVKTAFEVNGKEVISRDVRFLNSAIDSLQVVPASMDSLKIKYTLRRSDGYFDGEVRNLPVYPKGVERKKGYYTTLYQDTVVNWSFDPEKGPVTLYADANPTGLLKKKIDYLRDYRYGCNEQLASVLKGLLAAQTLEGELDLKKSDKRRIRQIVRKLLNNQNANGLWGWWNTSSTNMWISVHVVEALIWANMEGYHAPFNRKAITDEAVWNLISERTNRDKMDWLYISSMLNLGLDKGKFIRELESVSDLGLENRLRLMRVKQLNQQPVKVDWLLDSLKTDPFGLPYLEGDNRRSWYARSDMKLSTMALSILSADSLLAELPQTDGITNYLLSKLSSNRYENTYTLANAIAVLFPIIKGSQRLSAPKVMFSGDFTDTAEVYPYSKELHGLSEMTITKPEGSQVFIMAYQQEWEENPVKDSANFSVTSFFENGNVLTGGEPVKLNVEVEVFNDSEYVMIEIPIPGGCSYETKRNNFRNEVHREYFKEKVSIFCRKLRSGRHSFEVELLPRYSGNYVLNPAKIELMYFPVFYAHEGVKKVEIN